MQTHQLLVSPDGRSAIWAHPLDLAQFPQYSDWIDATHLDDDAFEKLVIQLQAA